MKVIVLGDGLLGKEIVKQTKWDYVSRKKDNLDFLEVRQWAEKKLDSYDVIVNCIACTKTYDDNKKNSWEINVKALDDLIEYCVVNNKKLVHISTDYIYTNSVSQASEEDVPVHLPTWYGYTKLVGDALVQLKMESYLICRLSHKPNPFPYELAWEDIKTNCDYVDVISSMVIRLIQENAIGVFNVGTAEKSIYELALRTREVRPIRKPEEVPLDTTMNLTKIKNLLHI